MLPSNTNVSEGQANGTQTLVEKVVLKPGMRASTVLITGGIPVPAVKSNQVDHIVLRHCNGRAKGVHFPS